MVTAGHVGSPAGVKQQRWIVKGPRRGINHFAVDAAVLVFREGRLSEFNETVLAREALPTLASNPRRIDSAG